MTSATVTGVKPLNSTASAITAPDAGSFHFAKTRELLTLTLVSGPRKWIEGLLSWAVTETQPTAFLESRSQGQRALREPSCAYISDRGLFEGNSEEVKMLSKSKLDP